MNFWKKFLLGTTLAFSAVYIGKQEPYQEYYNQSERELADEITVISANIARGEGRPFDPLLFFSPKPTQALEALVDLIVKEDVDIACLQEIEHALFSQKQPKKIADNTNLNYLFVPNHVHNFLATFQFADGNALFSKAFPYDGKRVSLETYKSSFGGSTIANFLVGAKAILHAKVNYQHDPIHLLCTHMSNWDTQLSGERERDLELKALFEYAVALKGPTIISGDFNAVPLSSSKQFSEDDFTNDKSWMVVEDILRKHPEVSLQYDPRLELFNSRGKLDFPGTYLGSIPEGALGTKRLTPDNYQEKPVLDYILVMNHQDALLRLELLSTKVDHSVYYSDHAPVLGKIKISKK